MAVTAKQKMEWLERYREGQEEIERLTEEIARLRALAEKVTIAFGGIGGGGTGEDRTQVLVERIEEKEKELEMMLKKHFQLEEQITAALDGLSNARHREILNLHYLQGYPWEDVAEKMRISYRRAFQLKKEAVSLLKILEIS